MMMKKIFPLLETLKLKGCRKNLDEIVNEAEQSQMSYITFLYNISRPLAATKKRILTGFTG